MASLCEALEAAKARTGRAISIVHVKTEKGHGLPAAGDHPYRMHFSFPFDPETGALRAATASRGYPEVAAEVVAEEMARDPKIVCVTPSTRYATGLEPVFKTYPERCFDPGMEEQHAMTMTVGLALGGLTPVVSYQSTFMQRAYDELFHDVCFMNLPTLILSTRVGFAGYDNPTHHGVYETSYVRSLPNLRVLYPKDGYELERMVRDALRSLTGPTLIEMPYGPVDLIDDRVLEESPVSFAAPEVLSTGEDMAIVAVGPRFKAAEAAREVFEARGISCGLVNLRYLKPLPSDDLLRAISNAPRVVVVEEAVLEGGTGSAIASLLSDRGLATQLLRVGLPCAFMEPGSADELAALYRVDASGIVAQAVERWPNIGR
jgi:1-deoxy-D-xylulose-5-phosphate synthase